MILLGLVSAGLHADAQSTVNQDDVVARLQDKALHSDMAWDLLASLTSEVGPRMAGSAADAVAVRWAVDKMHSLGFDRVWTEPVSFPRWLRNHETAQVLSPSVQSAST